jgi:L-fucose isomerase-like protein
MRKKQMLLTVLFLGTGLFISGCMVAAVGAGAGTTAYIMGKMKGTEAKDIDTVYNAAEKAAEQLKLNITEKTHDKMSGEIIARDSQDKKVTIKLKAASENVTDITIRVGFFGDETKTRLIYEKIHENLK